MDLPLVSIIIRTCARPHVLRQALNSVRNQTYKRIETVVVEDGVNSSENMVLNEFSDMNMKYYCPGTKVGRSCIGNLGLEKATGKYLNFLDDDDILFKEHVQCLVNVLEKTQYRVAYSISEERQISVLSDSPFNYKIKRKLVRYCQPFNQILLYHTNYLPIQCVMFERTLYDKAGGFDPSLDALEDWDLWVRYSTLEKFMFVKKITSAYYVVYNRSAKMKRDRRMHCVQEDLQKKFQQYYFTISVGQTYKDMDYVIRKYKTGKVKRYIRLIADFLMYGER